MLTMRPGGQRGGLDAVQDAAGDGAGTALCGVGTGQQAVFFVTGVVFAKRFAKCMESPKILDILGLSAIMLDES
jgi:hypothetical protein